MRRRARTILQYEQRGRNNNRAHFVILIQQLGQIRKKRVEYGRSAVKFTQIANIYRLLTTEIIECYGREFTVKREEPRKSLFRSDCIPTASTNVSIRYFAPSTDFFHRSGTPANNQRASHCTIRDSFLYFLIAYLIRSRHKLHQ